MKLHHGAMQDIASKCINANLAFAFAIGLFFFINGNGNYNDALNNRWQRPPLSCRVHYTEYLCGLVFRSNIDPISLLDLGELKQVFARANHFMPKQRPGEYEFQYKKRLAEVTSLRNYDTVVRIIFKYCVFSFFQLISNEIPLEKAWKNVCHTYVASITVIELGTNPLLHITQNIANNLKLFAHKVYRKYTIRFFQNFLSLVVNSIFGRFITVLRNTII